MSIQDQRQVNRRAASVVSTRMTIRPRLLVLALLIAAPFAWAQNNAADTQKLIEVLQLDPGETVAEIGAGGGDLTLALARHVGASGKVFTSELGTERLAKLRNVVEKSALPNVQVIEGQEAHANLPDSCCDAVFMRNVYHHFGNPATMNASFMKALKPGARLAVIDFPPRNDAATAPPGQRGEDRAHGVSPEVVAKELTAAGFQIVSTDDRPDRWFIVVAVKPAR